MDKRSQETLRYIEQNDAALTKLWIGNNRPIYFVHNKFDGAFNSSDSEDYSRLGAAIGNNNHLTLLVVADFDESALTVTNSEFVSGLKQNISIRELYLDCNNDSIVVGRGGVVHEILKVYQENNSHLTFIRISGARLQNGGGEDIIANTLRRCTNLEEIYLNGNNMTDALMPIIDAIRGHNKLEELHLDDNNIGDAGCEALATLLEDPSCNLRRLELRSNQIGDAGATIIANSLSRNNILQRIDLEGNSSINRIGDIFCEVLCNTSSINRTYSSNHTLIKVRPISGIGPQLVSLLKMNKDANKIRVAMKKILKYHPNIDMEPLFEWDAEEGEQNLKALPHIISWFDRAKVAVQNIDGKKLSAIYQFAMAMPTLFVPASHNEGGNKNSKKKQKLL